MTPFSNLLPLITLFHYYTGEKFSIQGHKPMGAGGQAAPGPGHTKIMGRKAKKWEGKKGEEEREKEEGKGRREKRKGKKGKL